MPATRDEEVDAVVVGSGAAGMMAAITSAEHGRQVLLLEKWGFVGGTTALSGGAIWLPEPDRAARLGIRGCTPAATTWNRSRPGSIPGPASCSARPMVFGYAAGLHLAGRRARRTG